MGWVASPVLPPGELTHVGLSAGPDDADVAVAESIAMATSLHGFRSRPGGRSRGGRGVVGREAALW
jgi:hypothetical protein